MQILLDFVWSNLLNTKFRQHDFFPEPKVPLTKDLVYFFQIKAISFTTQVTLTLYQNLLVTRDYIKSQFADQLDRH